MKILLLAFLLQSGSDDPDRQFHEEIAAERMKVAAELEKMKQFAWARAEYTKVLRLDPGRGEAKAKLNGPQALPRSNQGKGSHLPAKREELLNSVATKAATKLRIRAKALAEEERELEAQVAWRHVLLYAPGDPDARRALKVTGKGAESLDAAWGGPRSWDDMVSKADAGRPSDETSVIDRKWGGKNPKQVTANMTLEGVGLPADRLEMIARIVEADIAFMRLALGEPVVPHVNRLVFIIGEKTFHRYIDDFVDGKPEEKNRYKETGGHTDVGRKVHVMWCHPKMDAWFDLVVAHKVAEFMLSGWSPAWLQEGTAHFATHLLTKKLGAGCMALREGTDASQGTWGDAKAVDTALRDKVLEGSDDELETLLNAKLLTMTSRQLAKSMSLIRFLIFRHPTYFRALVRTFSEEVKIPRQEVEKALGFSLEELDEFWRRWYLVK